MRMLEDLYTSDLVVHKNLLRGIMEECSLITSVNGYGNSLWQGDGTPIAVASCAERRDTKS